VQVTKTIQTNEAVEVVENAPTAQEAQTVDQNAQGAEQNQFFADQNIDQNASNEPVMSVDLVPLASGSLPYEEVQLMAQITQNVNIFSSTMGSIVGQATSWSLIFSLLTLFPLILHHHHQ